MQQRRALAILALLVSVAAEEVPAEVDDECLPGEGGTGGSGACALSALQLRAQKLQQETQQAEHNAQLGERGGEEAAPRENASLLEIFSLNAQCFSYTGGSCASEACAPYRHATCESGRCVCNGCAGPDGRCYRQHNKLIAKNVLIRNGKYTHYKMYFQRLSTFGQMKTTMASSWMNLAQDKFDIYEVSGEFEGGKKAYFLVSTKWPDYVVGMKATTGTAISPFASYAVNLEKKGSLLDVWGPSNVMLELCETNGGHVRIGAKMAGMATVWSYVHHGSWYVYGSMTKPGAGGGWNLDPPSPKGTFPRC